MQSTHQDVGACRSACGPSSTAHTVAEAISDSAGAGLRGARMQRHRVPFARWRCIRSSALRPHLATRAKTQVATSPNPSPEPRDQLECQFYLPNTGTPGCAGVLTNRGPWRRIPGADVEGTLCGSLRGAAGTISNRERPLRHAQTVLDRHGTTGRSFLSRQYAMRLLLQEAYQ
jgi:hypothetical protein